MLTTTATAATEAALDLDAIKGALQGLDGFDPAALLPQLDTLFGRILLICRICVMVGPVLLLLLGLCYLFLAPKEANYYFGYRCFFGMGSVMAWQFTQRIAGLVFCGLGGVLTVVMLAMALSFGHMESMAMVWRTVWCLVWEAVLVLLALFMFDVGFTIANALAFGAATKRIGDAIADKKAEIAARLEDHPVIENGREWLEEYRSSKRDGKLPRLNYVQRRLLKSFPNLQLKDTDTAAKDIEDLVNLLRKRQ